MKRKESSNIKLNTHKTETNELIRPINDIIQKLNSINPTYSQINNIVITYRDKVFNIYSNLEKQNIDFWSNEFLLSDAIMKHLDKKVYDGIEEILSLATNVSKIKLILYRNKNKKQIENIKNIDNYIKNYDIKNNLYETLIEYYKNISIINLRPKDVIMSYIIIKLCLKDLKIDNVLSKEQELNIIQIIGEKESECIEYQKKINSLLEMINEIKEQKNSSKRIKK